MFDAVIICEFIGFYKVQTAEQKQSKLPKSIEKVLIFNKKVLSLQCEIIVLKNYKKIAL